MRKAIVALVMGLGLALGAAAAPAWAHTAPPCNDSGEPGNSDYAQHHIRPQAQEGQIGEGGHIPGTHRGYSACLGVHE